MSNWIFILPVFSAITGWLIIQALILIFFRVIFPRRKEQLAKRLSGVISEKFISSTTIEEKISSPENLQQILPFIENHIDHFLREKLGKEMPMISMFIGDKTVNKLKGALMKEIEILFPEVMKRFAGNLKSNLDLETLLLKSFNARPPAQFEKNSRKLFAKELRSAGLLAAAIGFISGVLEALLFFVIY